jgi:hypothetical protein
VRPVGLCRACQRVDVPPQTIVRHTMVRHTMVRRARGCVWYSRHGYAWRSAAVPPVAVAAGGQAAKKAAAALQKEAARLSAEEERRERAEAEALLAKARARRMAQEQEEGQGRPQGGVFLWAHLYAANCQTHFNDGTGRCAPVVSGLVVWPSS